MRIGTAFSLVLAVAASFALAACNSSGGSGGAGQTFTPISPASTGPDVVGAPTGDVLRNNLAGHTIRSTNVAGDGYCTYYNADGSLYHQVDRSLPEGGTWNVNGEFVCETLGGVQGCKTMDFLPLGRVTIYNAEGSGSFPEDATISAGDSCSV